MVKKTKIVQNTETMCKKDLKIAETFVGCGGSHFGFKKAGFKSIFVNDIWEDAIETLKINSDLNNNQILVDNIENIDDEYLKNRNISYDDLDVLFGGIVCKGFSLAGIRNPYDPRNYLYLQQLRLVELLKPKISIIENVPGIISMKILKKDDSIKDMCIKLTDICENHKKLRGKLIALTKDDTPQSIIDDVKNDLSTISFERKQLEESLEGYMYNVVEHIESLYENLGYKVYKKVLKCSQYNCATERKRLFIVAIRNDTNIDWEYPTPTTLINPPTVRDAFDMLDINGVNNPVNDIDNRPMTHKSSTIEKFKNIHSNMKSSESYFSRGTSSRLSMDKSAPTLVPGHSSFQIHPFEHRSITVREGAIITGFDKNFKFYGSHTSRCMQIGNAVPINMAYHMALQCKKYL
jgi:DNA (cytosine-5)-methyltransferase 1